MNALDVVSRAIGCFFVGSDVDAHDPSRWVPNEPCQRRSVPAIVEPEPVDKCVIHVQSEDARAQIADLWPWGKRADLGVTQTHAEHRGDHARVLVEARGDAERIGERQPPYAGRKPAVIAPRAARMNADLQRPERQLVRLLRVERPEQRPGERERRFKHRGSYSAPFLMRSDLQMPRTAWRANSPKHKRSALASMMFLLHPWNNSCCEWRAANCAGPK